jgi:opacity protein-like surface antigen
LFKQKTAYELSWSSDVCSSDLLPEYDTFFLVSHKNFKGIKFYNIGLEIGFIRNINITLGYEFVEQKNNFLNNFGLAIKFDFIKMQGFDLGFGFRSGGVLGQIFSTSLGIKL